VTGADTADQVVYGLIHTLTHDGVLRARVEADSAYFYEASQLAELFTLTVVFFGAQGEESSTIDANEGTYRWRTAEMEARGDVVGVTPDGKRLTTTILRYDPSSDELTGPEAFVFDEPGRHLEGTAFTADPDFSSVTATNPRGTVGRINPGNQ
jgi:LPS export ABC transporter protein LptC